MMRNVETTSSPNPAGIMHLPAGLVNGKSERSKFNDNYRRYFTTKRALCFQLFNQPTAHSLNTAPSALE